LGIAEKHTIERNSDNEIIKIQQWKWVYAFKYNENKIIVNVEFVGWIKEVVFDKNWNIIKYFHDEGDLWKYEVTYAYDNFWNMIKEIYNYWEDYKQINIYKYDKKWRIIVKRYDFNGNWEPDTYIYLKYNQKWEVTEEQFDNNWNNKIDEIVRYKYDKNWNIINEEIIELNN
jgi:hypothetical protein